MPDATRTDMNDCRVSHHGSQHEKRLRQRVAGVGRHLLIGQRLRKVHLSKSRTECSREGCKYSQFPIPSRLWTAKPGLWKSLPMRT